MASGVPWLEAASRQPLPPSSPGSPVPGPLLVCFLETRDLGFSAHPNPGLTHLQILNLITSLRVLSPKKFIIRVRGVRMHTDLCGGYNSARSDLLLPKGGFSRCRVLQGCELRWLFPRPALASRHPWKRLESLCGNTDGCVSGSREPRRGSDGGFDEVQVFGCREPLTPCRAHGEVAERAPA